MEVKWKKKELTFKEARDDILGQAYTQQIDDVEQIFDNSSPHPWLCRYCKQYELETQKGGEHHILCPIGKIEAVVDKTVEMREAIDKVWFALGPKVTCPCPCSPDGPHSGNERCEPDYKGCLEGLSIEANYALEAIRPFVSEEALQQQPDKVE